MTFTRHWRESKLDELATNNPAVSIDIAMETYDNWKKIKDEKISKRNKINGSNNRAIPENIEEFVGQLVRLLAICGHGISRRALAVILSVMLKEAHDGTEQHVSHGTLEIFIKSQCLISKDLKNVDPARIEITGNRRD